jgi:hypothetical protein
MAACESANFETTKFICSSCKKEFSQNYNLRQHVAKFHSNMDLPGPLHRGPKRMREGNERFGVRQRNVCVLQQLIEMYNYGI